MRAWRRRAAGAEGQGFRFAMAGLDGGRLNIAACSLGGAQAALDIALDYVQERRAFGRAMADFQNTQFRLADMRTELEAARALLWRACGEARCTARRTPPPSAPWPSAS